MSQTMNDKSYEILDAVLKHVPFEGWTSRALKMAMESTELPVGAEHIYAPDGALGLLRVWSDQLDQQMVEAIENRGFDNMRIRDKVTEAVWLRLELLRPHQEAARRAVSRLSLPTASGQAAAQLWASADAIWTAMGDTSEDYNYYTKRTILSGVIGSTLLAWLADDTDEKSEARAFLQRRIENVMQFEKFKGQTLSVMSNLPKPQDILPLIQKGPLSPEGRLRKGSSRRRRRY
ncbi:MAG: COQ9 family protein [Maricaulaceae bacterium]